MANPRFEHLNDVIDDDDGWRRRGDFDSDEDFQANRNPKDDSETVKRWKRDQQQRAAADKAQRDAAQSAVTPVTPAQQPIVPPYSGPSAVPSTTTPSGSSSTPSGDSGKSSKS